MPCLEVRASEVTAVRPLGWGGGFVDRNVQHANWGSGFLKCCMILPHPCPNLQQKIRISPASSSLESVPACSLPHNTSESPFLHHTQSKKSAPKQQYQSRNTSGSGKQTHRIEHAFVPVSITPSLSDRKRENVTATARFSVIQTSNRESRRF
jgi:hypothetical protein